MTEDIHDRLLCAELFEGPVDRETVQGWPSWAREHLQICPACQSMLAAERQLRDTVLSLAESRQRRLRSGPPSRAESAARLAARQAASIDSLVAKEQPLPHQTLRFDASPLELRRTSRGLRIWHPDAHEVLVLAAEEDQRLEVLRHHREDSPGVSLDLIYQPQAGARILALASNQPLEPEHWLMWLQDALRSDELHDLVAQSRSDFVHLADASIPPLLRSSLLRVQEEPLPDAHPDVAALLKLAAAAGREDNTAKAAGLYRQALELAFTNSDRTGQIKAGVGIAYAFKGMGYPVDGDKVLRWVVENHTLDATWANWVCRHMASDSLFGRKFSEAERWVREAGRVSGSLDAWSMLILISIYYAKEDWLGVTTVAKQMTDGDLPLAQRTHVESLAVGALVRRGHVDEARLRWASLKVLQDAPIEHLLQRAEVQLLFDSASAEGVMWSGLAAELVSCFESKDSGLLANWDLPPLLRLMDHAYQEGQDDIASMFLRLRFFDTVRAVNTEHRVLGLCASHRGLRVVSPASRPRVRELRISPERLSEMVSEARRSLRSNDDLRLCRALGQLLFEGPDLDPGLIWVGSDGALADAPMLAIACSMVGGGDELPSFRDLVGLRRPPLRWSGCRDIVSMADAQGNLPWAAREVLRSEASLWLRGKEVTKAAMNLEAPCGLLHLGLHARREQGVPELMFADGPMGPLEIAQLSLPGAPVVLLAGCFTAVSSTEQGVERSLADAFLRAGASAVVATRWPVLDREMHHFVRALVEAWPFEDAARQVTRICLDLRQQGTHARSWAAPVVY